MASPQTTRKQQQNCTYPWKGCLQVLRHRHPAQRLSKPSSNELRLIALEHRSVDEGLSADRAVLR